LLSVPSPLVVGAAAAVVGAAIWWAVDRPPAGVAALPVLPIVDATDAAAPPGTGAPTAAPVDPADVPMVGPTAQGDGPGGTVAGPPALGMVPSPSLTVHLAGAVATPGVVVVSGGSRVVEAVAAAGGLVEQADLTAVNLARPLVDGEMIVVPTPGQELPVAPVPGSAAGSADGSPPSVGPGAGAAPAGPGPIDVNRATVAELDTLPGIGPVLAGRIVAWRDETGPFTSVDELLAVPGIGPSILEEIRDLVTV
jgi:competence protein ComEA